jgi:hypothetical protein
MIPGIELLALGGKAAGKAIFAKVIAEALSALPSKNIWGKHKQEQVISKLFTKLSKVRQ